jgi:ankyrin repeat protein
MKEKTNGFELLKAGVTLTAFKTFLKDQPGLNKKSEDGNSYLHWAIIKGNKPVALYLIDEGCRLNEKNEVGITPLEYALQFGEAAIAEKLLEKKAKFFDRDGYSPLHAAAVSGNRLLVKRILEYLPNVNALDDSGRTPLHWACQEGKFETVKELIARGALVNVLCNTGMTPLRIAVGEGHVRIYEYLIKHGAVIGDFYYDLLTHNAVVWDHMEIVQLLMQDGVDINATDEYGNTPLHYAHMYRRPHIERVLLEKGANTRIQNRYGMLPLEADLEKYDAIQDAE